MTVKLLLLLAFIAVAMECAEITVPRNFTRSRYSQRKSPVKSVLVTNDTIVQLPASNEIEDVEYIIATNETLFATPSKSEAIESTIESDPQCGVKSNNNHPWIVILEHTDPTGRSSKKTLSKGVLIDDIHVLTTVSSLHNSRPFWTVSKVRLGDAPTWGSIDRNRSVIQRVAVSEIFSHKHKDIAIIRLAEPVKLSEAILPVCLPDDDNFGYRDLELHMCKRTGKANRVTKVSNVPASPLKSRDCSIMLERKQAKLTHTEFCAWDETGDTCTGDLGGPLVGKRIDGRYQVIGLNSYVHTKKEIKPAEYPGIYTRVGSHLKWIRTVLEL